MECVFTSCLTIALESEPGLTGAKLLRQFQTSLSHLSPVIAKYCSKSAATQRDSLHAMEEFCAEHANEMLPIASKVNLIKTIGQAA